MKNKNHLIVSFLIFFLAIGFLSCGNKKNSDIAYYTCPMHPQIQMETTGQCPICGMDLVPVKKKMSESHSEHDKHQENNSSSQKIQINPRYTQNIGVLTEKVQKRDLIKTILSYGKVAHDKKLWIAQTEYIQALNLRDHELIKATERKLLFLGLSEKWIANIRKTKSTDITLHLKTDKIKPKYIEAYVYQEDVGLMKEDLNVEITDQKGQFLANGTIKAIGTLVDLNSRSIRVLVESESFLNLKLNTFVQVKIKVPLGEKLSLPTQAILFNGTHNMVYLAKGNGVFEPKKIQIGKEAENYHEVLKGLNEDDIVVTNGHFLIDSESQIKFGNSTNKHHH